MDKFFKRATCTSYKSEEKQNSDENISDSEKEEEKEEEEINFRRRPEEDTYEKIRNKHKTDNYIPVNYIKIIFSHHFKNSTILHNINDDIKLCNIKILDLLNTHIINWELNREPDEVRVPEIARYIYESRERIQTMLYLNYNFKQNRFEIIDGTHRYCALKMIKSLSEENGQIIDERLRNADGENVARWFNSQEDINWLLNSHVIVQINFKSTNNELIVLRDDINHSQPMPIELRENFQNIEKNGIVNRIADEYITKYKKCFGQGSDKYLKGKKKISRDKFIILLSNIYDKYNININRIGTLHQRLEIANNKIRIELEENKIKCSESIKNICRETGCYLFLYRDDKLQEFI